MSLATATKEGAPSVRIVLLKKFDERGFVFFTNLTSRKGQELAENPLAALCFYWMPLTRQVRIEGRVEPVSDAEADEYYNTRMLFSRLGAWASKQSQLLPSRDMLINKLKEKELEFQGKDPPRPPFWSGFRLVPEKIEFWEEGDHRLHNRRLFTRSGSVWEECLLYP